MNCWGSDERAARLGRRFFQEEPRGRTSGVSLSPGALPKTVRLEFALKGTHGWVRPTRAGGFPRSGTEGTGTPAARRSALLIYGGSRFPEASGTAAPIRAGGVNARKGVLRDGQPAGLGLYAQRAVPRP